MAEARSTCASMGGGSYLTSIKSKEENNFVFNLNRGKDTWIGGQKYGAWWRWEDGSSINSGYNNWESGGLIYSKQPDGDGDCMLMDGSYATWFDTTCKKGWVNKLCYAVCKIDL